MDRDQERNSKPTSADLEAAKRLKAIWKAIPEAERPTQEAIGERWTANKKSEDGKIGQGMVAQYINGHTPLNLTAVLEFASILGCKPTDIRSDLPGLRGGDYTRPVSSNPSEKKVVPLLVHWPFKVKRDRYDKLNTEQKKQIDVTVCAMIQAFEAHNRDIPNPRRGKRQS